MTEQPREESSQRASLASAIDTFLDELIRLRPDENFLIYVDRRSDANLTRAMEARAKDRSARVTVLQLETGSTLDEQSRQLIAAVRSTRVHAICELSAQYFYHTPAWPAARDSGARIFSLGALDEEAFVRCVGNVDHGRMYEFGTRLERILRGAVEIRIRTAKGTDIRMRLRKARRGDIIGRLFGRPRPYVLGPCGILTPSATSTFLGGQLAFMPDPETIEGRAVIDGYMWPPDDIGGLDAPIVLEIKRGKISEIEGSPVKSKVLKNWFEKERRSIWIEHFCLGFHPCCTFRGKLMEAERTFGSITTGMGKLAHHTDGVMTNASIYADGIPIQEDGVFVHPDLADGSDRMRPLEKEPGVS